MKVKYIVLGIDDRSLGQLIGLVVNGGEVSEGPSEILSAPGNPQAFTIDAGGFLRPTDFCKCINALAQAERAKLKAKEAVQDFKLGKEVAAAVTATAKAEGKKDENPTAA